MLCLFLLIKIFPVTYAFDRYPRNINADVIHYEFDLAINDSTDRIDGRASIKIKILNDTDSLSLDLIGRKNTGKGMIVTNVSLNDQNVKWKQKEESLIVFFNNQLRERDTLEIIVDYNGIPSDGLIISKNKYGNRTFFADHWPDRAHCYLPCIDHPYDKASVDFVITAPGRYKIVASGILVEESDLADNKKLTHWSEAAQLATKVMTFGAAEFAVRSAGIVSNVPVWSWVFPENRKEGFYDYSVAVRPLEYFSKLIGPYPYKKLADVQSKTIYGGLENAGTIFYSENSVTGLGKAEGLIAHEIAHQWFGDCVTENDWYHVWLSEGFATYVTSLYFESFEGKERLKSDMESARTRVLKYYEKNPEPVIDTTLTNLMDLLNPNSYQKGAWVLHMLRHDLGDSIFIKGLQLYYDRFYNSNALTEDLRNVMEEVSGRNLEIFFRQWLYTKGQPELRIWHEKGKKKGTIEVYIEQKQVPLFEFNLELLIKGNSIDRIDNVAVKKKITKIVIPLAADVVITPDPNVNLLFKQY